MWTGWLRAEEQESVIAAHVEQEEQVRRQRFGHEPAVTVGLRDKSGLTRAEQYALYKNYCLGMDSILNDLTNNEAD